MVDGKSDQESSDWLAQSHTKMTYTEPTFPR